MTVHLRKSTPSGSKEWIIKPDLEENKCLVMFGKTGTELQCRTVPVRRYQMDEIQRRAQGKISEGYRIVSTQGVFVHGPNWPVDEEPTENCADQPGKIIKQEVWTTIGGLDLDF